MLFSRILGGIGRVLIACGALILLFVTYQLWGTGIRTGAAQNDLRTEFTTKQAETQRSVTANGGVAPTTSTTAATTTTLPALNADGTPITAPATNPAGTAPPTSDDVAAPRPGESIGQIVIPAIGADFIMVEGVDLNDLSKGPGHFPGTPFPGQAGNAALAGHRTTWLAPFNRIDELVEGDTVTVTTLQGEFTYKIISVPGDAPGTAYKIVAPNQTEILDQPEGQNTLTLMACHPKYSAAQRIVVVAELVNPPAATTAKSPESQAAVNQVSDAALFGGTGGDLVGGNPDSQNTAILWGLVAAAIWLVAWLIARFWPAWRQWQRWAVFVVAFPIFLVPLFFTFENINRLLPAGY